MVAANAHGNGAAKFTIVRYAITIEIFTAAPGNITPITLAKWPRE